MEGFGVHTFRLINAEGRSTFVKFHWKPKVGLQSVVWNEAVKINGADPDFHRRDLWDAITAGDFPEWELGLQLFDENFADRFAFDVLDPTKIIPEDEVPVRRVGRLVLDRVVDNFFAETEQVAFCTQNIVPGIDFTNDPLLQGRNFSYLDTQVKRLGSPNFTHLPVNAPKCPVAHFQQDGHLAMTNPQGRVNYEPNTWDPPGPREDPAAGFRTYPDGQGDEAGPKRRLRPESFADHYSQARQFLVSQTEAEQQHIVDAFVFELSKCDRMAIRTRMVAGLRNVDEDLARSLADGLGLPDALPSAREPVRDLPASRALSILANGPGSFAGRKLGILVADGADAAKLAQLTAAAEEAKVNVELVAPAVGGIQASDGHRVPGRPEDRWWPLASKAGREGGRQLEWRDHDTNRHRSRYPADRVPRARHLSQRSSCRRHRGHRAGAPGGANPSGGRARWPARGAGGRDRAGPRRLDRRDEGPRYPGARL